MKVSQKPYDLYSLLNVFEMMLSNRKSVKGNVAHREKIKYALVGKPEGKGPYGISRRGWRVILKCIL